MALFSAAPGGIPDIEPLMFRRYFFWLLAIAFMWIVISRLTEIQVLAETLAQGRWQWVAAACAFQFLNFTFIAAAYRAAFWAVGVKSRLLQLIPLAYASVFMGVAAPSIGASGAALFMDDAARRGESPARAAAGALLYLASNLVAYFMVLVVGMVYLFLQDNLHAFQVAGAVILMLFIALLSGVLLLGLWRPGLLSRLLAFIQRLVNGVLARLRRPPAIQDGWPERSAREFSQAAAAMAQRPSRLLAAILMALVSHLMNLTSLFMVFMAFNQHVRLGVLVASYAMGLLFWIVTVVPHGIGVVEGVMTLVVTSLGVPAETATVITLAFRGLGFWLPFAVGFIMLRRIRVFRAKEAV